MSDTSDTTEKGKLVEMPGRDRGEGAANIYLLDGQISVRNQAGDLLLEGIAKDGFWDSLWALMENNLRVTYRVTRNDF